jgi:hypothetical protein
VSESAVSREDGNLGWDESVERVGSSVEGGGMAGEVVEMMSGGLSSLFGVESAVVYERARSAPGARPTTGTGPVRSWWTWTGCTPFSRSEGDRPTGE